MIETQGSQNSEAMPSLHTIMPFDRVCTNSLGKLIDPLTWQQKIGVEINGKKWSPDF